MLDRLRQRERLIILPSPSPTWSSRLSARANAVHARSTPEASLGGLGALSERAFRLVCLQYRCGHIADFAKSQNLKRFHRFIFSTYQFQAWPLVRISDI
jgi:hypothetical protein